MNKKTKNKRSVSRSYKRKHKRKHKRSKIKKNRMKGGSSSAVQGSLSKREPLKLSLSQLRERERTLTSEQKSIDLLSQRIKYPVTKNVSLYQINPEHDIVKKGIRFYQDKHKDNVLILSENECLIFFNLYKKEHDILLKEFTDYDKNLENGLDGSEYNVLLISNNMIQGYINAHIPYNFGTLFQGIEEDVVEIFYVHIFSDIRGSGYCKGMVKYMLINLKQLGISYVYLEEASKFQVAACKCYYKAGLEAGFKVRMGITDVKTLLIIARELNIPNPEKYKGLLKNIIKENYGWKFVTLEIKDGDSCYFKKAPMSSFYYTLD